MKGLTLRIAIFLPLLFAISATQATTYKCTNASGETQYTAVPPKDAQCEALTVRKTGIKTNADTPKESVTSTSTSQTSAPPKSGLSTENEDIKRINKANCDRSRANLELLTTSTRIRLKEGDNYRVIPEQERQEKMKLAQEQIDAYCE